MPLGIVLGVAIDRLFGEFRGNPAANDLVVRRTEHGANLARRETVAKRGDKGGIERLVDQRQRVHYCPVEIEKGDVDEPPLCLQLQGVLAESFRIGTVC